jgi:hypothetical protein
MAIRQGTIPALSAADYGENGGNPAATNVYQKLKMLSADWNDGEIAFVNAIRALYRSGQPLGKQDQLWGALAFTGAHVRISGDGGVLYSRWLAMGKQDGGSLDVGMRTGLLSGSSHESDMEQYEVKLKGAGAILVGCGAYPQLGKEAHTWFQSEKFPATGSAAETVGHTLTFVEHVGSGFQQVGKFGKNPFSEKKGTPVVVKFSDKLMKEAKG